MRKRRKDIIKRDGGQGMDNRMKKREKKSQTWKRKDRE